MPIQLRRPSLATRIQLSKLRILPSRMHRVTRPVLPPRHRPPAYQFGRDLPSTAEHLLRCARTGGSEDGSGLDLTGGSLETHEENTNNWGERKMYTEFYELREIPFGLTPNPKFIYKTESHLEVVSNLQYCISQSKGLAMVTGEV